MISNDFCAFILTHGRANKVLTYDSLIKCGYTGKIYIVIDDEDKQRQDYENKFGKENVLIFSKKEQEKHFDKMDASENRKTIVFARNVCFDLAKKVGCKYFIELDDDYTVFSHRVEKDNSLLQRPIYRLDDVLNAMLEFYKNTNISTIALAQGGDFIGGVGSRVWKEKLSRKAMNSFICSTERPFNFIGRINEDVNTYCYLGSKGKLFFTLSNVMLNQLQTQKNNGGMTETYLDSGTYVKSFYTIMCMPSAVKIDMMGDTHKRIHHHIEWENCVPKILNNKYKK